MQDPLNELGQRVSKTESAIESIKTEISLLKEIPSKIEDLGKKLDNRNETIFSYLEKHTDVLTEVQVDLAKKPNIDDCDAKHDRLSDIKAKNTKSVLDIAKWILVLLGTLGIGVGGGSKFF